MDHELGVTLQEEQWLPSSGTGRWLWRLCVKSISRIQVGSVGESGKKEKLVL